MKRPGLTVFRDVTSYVGGWLLICKQAGIVFVPPPQPNDTLIWIAALLIGVPGVAQIIAMRFGGSAASPGGSTTAPPPSLPPARDSSLLP